MSTDANLFYSLYRFRSCRELFDELRNIPYALVKGEALSYLAYGKAGKRQYADIDILIPKNRISEVEKILSRNGFQMADSNRQDRIHLLLNSHQVSPWNKQVEISKDITIDVSIDINFDILWGEYEGTKIDMEEFLQDVQETNLLGISVKTLTPIKALIQLALHHYKDMNSIYLLSVKKTIDYKMFDEIYHLIMNHLGEITPELLNEMCDFYKIKAYIYYVLYYTNQVFGSDVIGNFLEVIKNKEGENLIPFYGLKAAERKKWKIDFNTRLSEGCLIDYLKEELTQEDLKKIDINRRLF